MKKILIVLDGAAGLPLEKLQGYTPLEVAHKPNLDFLAKEGIMGYMYPIDEITVPGSDNSLVAIFGNDPKKCRRGVYEALGLGIKLKKGDLALRTNFGTINNLSSRKVLDRRAGRTLSTSEAKILAEAINKKVKLKCKFVFAPAVQHRGVLVLKGNFSDKITNTDPEWNKLSSESVSGKSLVFDYVKPLDNNKRSKETAEILNEFIFQAFNVLDNHPINLERKQKGLFPANMLFLRGGGVDLPKIKQYKKWMSLNAMPLEIGISRASGMEVFSFVYPELSGIDVYQNLYDGLNKSIHFIKKTLKKHHKNFEGCYIQIKETDIPGHDNKPFDKIKMIELIDRDLMNFVGKMAIKHGWRLVVTCDHSTPCKLKRHSPHPVPVLVYDDKHKDDAEGFNEREAWKGKLGKIYGRHFMKKTGLLK